MSTVLFLLAGLAVAIPTAIQSERHLGWATSPPMGWNSWDYFGTTLTEVQAKEQAAAMARLLLPHGWNVFTVDIQWYEPNARGHVYQPGAPLEMDEFGRLLPAPNRFPSAANGAGFKPLADHVHRLGLKFGLHIMRGIPRQAVVARTPVKGTSVTAADIADISSTCAWNPDMYGVDMTKPSAQAYYDSLFELYAGWGIDFIKVDDIARPYDATQQSEIEAIRKAIDKTGRPIVLSLSPGDTPVEKGAHVNRYANMWRISDDFWDRWEPLEEMFGRLDRWTPHRRAGAWPDADMLPFGKLEFGRPTRFTQDEQRLCMSLWSIAGSPLILGADMTQLDPFTLDLLTNKAVIEVNQKATDRKQLWKRNKEIVWSAKMPGTSDLILGVFNLTGLASPFDESRAKYRSQVVKGEAGATRLDVRADLTGSKKLFLVVGDAGDGFAYDHAGWHEPKLIGEYGERRLSELNWKKAEAGWGGVAWGKGPDGQTITPTTLGTHSVSIVEYDLPAGTTGFTATASLLPGSIGNGSVQFFVYDETGLAHNPAPRESTLQLRELGWKGKAKVTDLWNGKTWNVANGEIQTRLPSHGATLLRVTPLK